MTTSYKNQSLYSGFGRPTKYNPEVELTEINILKFPVSLDSEMEDLCKAKGISKIDFVLDLIKKESRSKKVLTRRPLDDDLSKTKKRSFRRIPVIEWNEFQIKALYYNLAPSNLLLLLIQEEILKASENKELLKGFHKPIALESLGKLRFSPKIPTPIYEALHAVAEFMGESVNNFINWLINEMTEIEIDQLKPFPTSQKTQYSEPRLDDVDRKKWILFRAHCLRSGFTTHEMLATYLYRKIHFLTEKNQNSNIRDKVSKALASYDKKLTTLL